MSAPPLAMPDPHALLSPAAEADPYPVYQQMRAAAPVYRSPIFNGWMLTHYADVKAFLQDPRVAAGSLDTGVLATLPEELQDKWTAIFQFLSLWVIGLNPPEHRRLRHLMNAGFKPRLVENLRARIQTITDELIDAVQAAGQIEAIGDFGYPLPAMVIGELLGMPASGRPLLRAWSQTIATFLSTGIQGDHAVIKMMHQTLGEVSDYLREIIAARRRAPQDDLISGLIAAEEQGSVLNEAELVASCVMLLFAGHETTMNLIGNGLVALLRHPDQYEQLVADPGLTPNAVEEFLRYDGPVQVVWRAAAEDITIGEQQIRAGERIIPCLGAANRDPAQFPDPDRLDIRRANAGSNITFGHGIHYCLGAPLARLEAQIAFATLLRRLPGLRPTDEAVVWRGLLSVRGVQALPLAFDQARAHGELR
ncbi:MAG: cytochrome P450 [Roseiflexaceae bacterium]